MIYLRCGRTPEEGHTTTILIFLHEWRGGSSFRRCFVDPSRSREAVDFQLKSLARRLAALSIVTLMNHTAYAEHQVDALEAHVPLLLFFFVDRDPLPFLPPNTARRDPKMTSFAERISAKTGKELSVKFLLISLRLRYVVRCRP